MQAELARFREALDELLRASSRANEAKPRRSWYPLSEASYGVEEILEALDSLVRFRTTMWEKTERFEKAFAGFHGSRHAVMVNSGSSADLLLSFLLIDPEYGRLRAGDEVLVPAVTWPTHVWAPKMAGLRIRLVDIDPETLNICPRALADSVGERTRALFLVHLLGNPCDMSQVLEVAHRNNLTVLEDCCEALGSTWDGKQVGTFGMGAAFSFFFSHHLTTMEGGMVTTNDDDLATQLRILRAHGWVRNVGERKDLGQFDVDPRYAFVSWGFNLRPTELQAGFGLRQLERLPRFGERRALLAKRFFSFIDQIPYLKRPRVHALANPVWMALPIVLSAQAPFSRQDFVRYLEESGVETRPIVAGSLAKQPVARLFAELREGDHPGADLVHRRGLYVGLSGLVTDESMARLIACIEDFVSRY